MNKRPVKDINPQAPMTVNDLIMQFHDAGGFTATHLSNGVDILEQMIKEKECLKFLSFPACLCATGTRGVIKDMIKKNLFDVIITTSGTIDHDLARVWKHYYHGTFYADDDSLHQQGINRLGNVFIPNECYGSILEEKIQPIIEALYEEKKKWSTKELLWAFGEKLSNEPNGKDSILYWAYKNKIPIIVPGITDGSFGSQLWMNYQHHRDFTIDLFADEQHLSDLVFNCKKSGALILGGGISKHHTIWWNQYKDGLDYAVYITTAVEYDGSLSGALTREAVSWGKIKERSDHVNIAGDATVLLPVMISSLYERLLPK
jgi:deoxyhypusine synthase